MNEIDEDILFAGDESDTLFIAAVQHDPVTADIIKKFPHMLGDEGEEFIASFPSVGEEAIDMDSLVFIEKETFDLDQAISNATMEEADPLSPFIMDDIAFESSDHTIDLDQIFDVMQITTVTTPPEITIPDFSADAAREMVPLDSSGLSISVLGDLDPSAGIDDLFKKMVFAEES